MKTFVKILLTLMVLTSTAHALDDSTKKGIVDFTLVTAIVFMVSSQSQPDDAKLTFFNGVSFEVGANTPIEGYSALCANEGSLTSSGEVRINIFEKGMFYGDVIPWSHRSCIAERDTFVIDTFSFRLGVTSNY